jgi:hypothetical protein
VIAGPASFLIVAARLLLNIEAGFAKYSIMTVTPTLVCITLRWNLVKI